MPSIPFTTDTDAVPEIDAPEPDTDRGLPAFVGVPVLVFVATAVALLVGSGRGS